MIFDKISKEERERDNVVSIYTTCSGLQEAKDIGFSAIRDRLAACVDFWPISSIYPWQGVIEEIDQYILIFTTQKAKCHDLIQFIGKMHSYKIPFISQIDTKNTSFLYKNWVDKTLNDEVKYVTSYEKKIIKKKEAEGVYHPGELK